MYGESRRVYIVLVGKPEGKRPLGRSRRTREDGSSRSGNVEVWPEWSWFRMGTHCGHL